MEKSDLVCEREPRALNMSKKTKHVKVMVVSLLVTCWSLISRQKIHNVPMTMTVAEITTLTSKERVIIRSFTRRGGCFRTSGSTGSTPRLVEWKRVGLGLAVLLFRLVFFLVEK